jgi:hypothetical protein
VLSGEKLGEAETPSEVYSLCLKCWEKETKNRAEMPALFEELTRLYEIKIGRRRKVTGNTGNSNYVTVAEAYN